VKLGEGRKVKWARKIVLDMKRRVVNDTAGDVIKW